MGNIEDEHHCQGKQQGITDELQYLFLEKESFYEYKIGYVERNDVKENVGIGDNRDSAVA